MTDIDLLRQSAFVAGHWIAAHSGRTLDVINPATGLVIGTAPDMGETDTRAAIAVAEAACVGWKSKTAAERATGLEVWHALMLPI